MKNYRRNNYIGKMKKGFKQKLSLLMIACLLFTGYRGLTISGRADSSHTEQNNEIEVSGSQVKVQLLGADLRRAATEAILKGEKVGKSNLRSYSKDQELATEFEEYFDGEKEIYNIPLNSIAENLEESLNAEEAGLQIYVERDAKNLDRLVRKESKESLLLYSKESAVAGLLPKKEEATTVSLTEEEKASDSNLERNTELTGSELITFVYENKSTERMTFQLSVDGNKYPKVTVASKTSLFKQFLGDAKKAQAEAKNAKATEAKAESTEAQTVEASKAEESSTEAKQEVAESKATAETKATEESKASEEARKDDSEVAIVSTAAEAVAESTEAKAEVKTEASEEATEAKVETTETEVKETAAKAETAQAEKATGAQKAVVEDSSLLKDITEHSEEILPELQSIRFTQYSLNELGRKSQNVEIEGFGNVQVFYDEAAFDGDVVLEAKRLFKPDEEVEGEKLSEEQVKVLKEHSIYDDAASLDIRFVDKKDSAVEVEPKSPVSVRISIEKKALPEDASSDTIAIHHLVENNATKEIEKVDTVVQSNNSKNLILTDGITNTDEVEKSTSTLKTEDDTKDETITKEFTVDSFSLYQITWKADAPCELCDAATYIRFHYVDKNFNEIGPTKRVNITAKGANWHYDRNDTFKAPPSTKPYAPESEWLTFRYSNNKQRYYIDHKEVGTDVYYDSANKEGSKAVKKFDGYHFLEVYPYNPKRDNMETHVHGVEDYFTINWSYGPGNTDFREGIKRIDNTGYTLPTILYGTNTDRFTWFTKDRGEEAIRLCETNDFYFVYDTTNKKADQRKEEPRNEKYIKDNLDGTYDLTLTGQVSKKKEKLDIIFLLDSTKSMNSSFEKDITKEKSNNSAALGTSKKEVTKRYLVSLVDNLSKNSNYDLQYALVGFGGERTEKDNGNFVYAGNEPDVITKLNEDTGRMTITDTAWNDTTHVYGFTSSAEKFKANLANLPESRSENTGANYTAAIEGLKYLLKDETDSLITSRITNVSGNVSNNGRRSDAKKIVVMISGTDPTYGYVREDGEYDDTFITDRVTIKPSRSAGVHFHTNFKAGYSYGNGQYFSRVGLNQARGILSTLDGYAAFYSVGIGDTENWKHLKELTQAHGYDQSKKWEKFGTKFIRAKSALAEGADSEVFNGKNPAALLSSFSELERRIAPKVTDFTITDTLSENVTLVKNTELKAEVYKMKDNGVEVAEGPLNKEQMQDLGLNGFNLTKPDPSLEDGGVIQLKTIPSDFSLPAGYEIRLTATIKPSAKAYKKLKENGANTVKGDWRTDIQDIYSKENITLPSDFSDAAMYGTSAGKYGLYTNKEAEFTYKWNGKDRKRDYPKPIIKVRDKGYLKVYKGFVGFGDKLYNKETQEWTALGKDVLKKVSFDVYMQVQNGQDKLITTVNLGDQKWIDSKFDSTKTYPLENGYILKIYPVESGVPDARNNEPKYTGHRFVFEINDLPKGLKYRVVEKIEGKTVEELEGKHKTYTVDSYTYKYNGNELLRKTEKGEEYNSMPVNPSGNPDGNTYVFNNFYELTEKNIKIKIRKEVQELGGMPFSKEAKQQSFDFYLALYKDEIIEKDGKNVEMRKSYSKKELEDVIKELNSDVKYLDGDKEVPVEVIEVENIQTKEGGGVQADALEQTHYAIHFKLKHDAEISFMLKKGMKYRVYEKKVDGYNRPTYTREVVSEQTGKTITKNADVLANEGLYYTCSTYKIVEEETITWKNPRITMVPTGLVRDITPFVWGIFGFVAMAGAYFVINKKRREA